MVSIFGAVNFADFNFAVIVRIEHSMNTYVSNLNSTLCHIYQAFESILIENFWRHIALDELQLGAKPCWLFLLFF